jgi:hypothetical protein
MLYLEKQLYNCVLKSVKRIVLSGIALLACNAGAAQLLLKGTLIRCV